MPDVPAQSTITRLEFTEQIPMGCQAVPETDFGDIRGSEMTTRGTEPGEAMDALGSVSGSRFRSSDRGAWRSGLRLPGTTHTSGRLAPWQPSAAGALQRGRWGAAAALQWGCLAAAESGLPQGVLRCGKTCQVEGGSTNGMVINAVSLLRGVNWS